MLRGSEACLLPVPRMSADLLPLSRWVLGQGRSRPALWKRHTLKQVEVGLARLWTQTETDDTRRVLPQLRDPCAAVGVASPDHACPQDVRVGNEGTTAAAVTITAPQ